MAFTFVGEVLTPADNAAQAGPTVTVPLASLNALGLQAGDFVVAIVQKRTTDRYLQWVKGDGQGWSDYQAQFPTSASAQTCKLYSCQFNGRWLGDLTFTDAAGGATPMSVRVIAWRPSAATKFVTVHKLTRTTYAAPGSPFTVTINGVTTTKASTLSVAVWSSSDVNTWGTLAGSGWSQSGLTAQHRNSSGSGLSNAAAYNIQTATTTLANVSLNQATNGGDAGVTYLLCVAEVDLPVGGSGTFGAFVQNKHSDTGSTTGTTLAATFNSAVTSGRMVWGHYHSESALGIGIPDTILDDKSNEYYILGTKSYEGLGQTGTLFFRPNITNAPVTVTVTQLTGENFRGLTIVEQAGSYAFDQMTANTWLTLDTSNPDLPATAGLIPAEANEFFVGAIARTGDDTTNAHVHPEFSSTPPWTTVEVGDGDSATDCSVRLLATYLQPNTQYAVPFIAAAQFGLQDILLGACFKNARPTITAQPADVNANAGDSAVFNITATASGGALHYQWKFNGANVGTDSSTYTRTALSTDSGGAVTCVVTDDNGTTTSSTAVLRLYATAFQWDTFQRNAFQEYAAFAGSAATTVNCTVGNLVLGNVGARVILTTVIRGTIGSLILGPVNARVQVATAINTTRGNLTLGPVNARVQVATAINAGRGNLVLGNVRAGIGQNVGCTVGNLTLGGVACRVVLTTVIRCGVGNMQLQGVPCTVSAQATTNINCTVGNLALGRVNARVADTTRINAGVGNLVLGNVAARLILPTVVRGTVGNLLLGSVAAQVTRPTPINCTVGGLTLGRVNARVQVATAVNTTRGNLVLGSRAATVVVREATVISCRVGGLTLGGVQAQITTIAPAPPAPPPTVGGGGGPGQWIQRRKRVRVALHDSIEDRLVIVARTTPVIRPLARQIAAIADQVSDGARVLQRAHWTPGRAALHVVDEVDDTVLVKVGVSDPDLQALFDLLMEADG